MSSKKIKEPVGEFIISPNAQNSTVNGMCRAYFGQSFERLVNDIHKNVGGKFDFLYE